MEKQEQTKTKAESEALENDAEAFHQQMDMKRSFPVNLRRTDSLGISFFDFRKSDAPSETRYCANIVYSEFFINFSIEILNMQERSSWM